MTVEPEAKLDRNEISTLRRICGFNLKDKKNTEIRRLLGLDPVSLTILRVDCGILYILSVRTMRTGSSDV